MNCLMVGAMHLSGHFVLIIEHRSTSRLVLIGIVRGIDSQIVVEEKPDANGTIAWTKDKSPSLVVSDYQMPEKDGTRLIRQLRELPPWALVPIICSNRRSGQSGARAGPRSERFPHETRRLRRVSICAAGICCYSANSTLLQGICRAFGLGDRNGRQDHHDPGLHCEVPPIVQGVPAPDQR
jgi:CheY-like chemotaxis protein